LLYIEIACYTSVKLFADDTTTYRVVNTLSEAIEFQLHINLIEEWCVNWQRTVNIKKCFIVHLGRSNQSNLVVAGNFTTQ